MLLSIGIRPRGCLRIMQSILVMTHEWYGVLQCTVKPKFLLPAMDESERGGVVFHEFVRAFSRNSQVRVREIVLTLAMSCQELRGPPITPHKSFGWLKIANHRVPKFVQGKDLWLNSSK